MTATKSAGARMGVLERRIRAEARERLQAEIGESFAAAIAAAANDDAAAKALGQIQAGLVRARRLAAERAALEAFLTRAEPAGMTISEALRPQGIRLDVNGKRLDYESGDEHIAVLYPNFAHGQSLIVDARDPVAVDEIRDAPEAVAEIELFGEPTRLLTDLEWQVVIDRRFRDPAVDPRLFPRTPTGRWYPTSTRLVEKDGSESPSGYVWAVGLNGGDVRFVYPGLSGFVRGGRLAPASQF